MAPRAAPALCSPPWRKLGSPPGTMPPAQEARQRCCPSAPRAGGVGAPAHTGPARAPEHTCHTHTHIHTCVHAHDTLFKSTKWALISFPGHVHRARAQGQHSPQIQCVRATSPGAGLQLPSCLQTWSLGETSSNKKATRTFWLGPYHQDFPLEPFLTLEQLTKP